MQRLSRSTIYAIVILSTLFFGIVLLLNSPVGIPLLLGLVCTSSYFYFKKYMLRKSFTSHLSQFSLIVVDLSRYVFIVLGFLAVVNFTQSNASLAIYVLTVVSNWFLLLFIEFRKE